MTCQVFQCRYPNTHTTESHLCGNIKCNHSSGRFGHGIMECRDGNRYTQLQCKIIQSSTPKWLQNTSDYCRVPLCNSRHTHTTEAHHCRLCYMRHQGDHTCPIMYIDSSLASYTYMEFDFDKNYRHYIYPHIKQTNLNTNWYIKLNANDGYLLYVRCKNDIVDTFYKRDYDISLPMNEHHNPELTRAFEMYIHGCENFTDKYSEICDVIPSWNLVATPHLFPNIYWGANASDDSIEKKCP